MSLNIGMMDEKERKQERKERFDASLGAQIKELREARGWSQQYLADRLGCSRGAVSQMEAGARKVSAAELNDLSRIFAVSSHKLLGGRNEATGDEKSATDSEEGLQIRVPSFHQQKFKETLLYILNQVGAKPNVGETVLYKLLYFIDFDFYEKYERSLTGATYLKNRHGPTPREFRQIVEQMIKDKDLEKVKSQYYEFPQTKYLPRRKERSEIFQGHELREINRVLNALSDKNATEISEYSHGDVPWMVTEEGKEIDYETVFYRTPRYSVREYGEEIP